MNKTLEIEKKLNNMSSPLLCHFCNEPITKMTGRNFKSLCNHHITYVPEVIAPSHLVCHVKYHKTHPDHPTDPEIEYRKKFIENLDEMVVCHFCGEEITKLWGRESDALGIHSLDGNHNNWELENKVPAHNGCHSKYHVCLDHPMKKPEVRAKASENMKGHWTGDKNPMKNPEAVRMSVQTRRGRGFKTNNKTGWITRRELYPPSGFKDIENFGRKMSERKDLRGDNNPSRRPEVREKKSDKMMGENNPFYGKHHSKETLARISERVIESWKLRREKYGSTGRNH